MSPCLFCAHCEAEEKPVLEVEPALAQSSVPAPAPAPAPLVQVDTKEVNNITVNEYLPEILMYNILANNKVNDLPDNSETKKHLLNSKIDCNNLKLDVHKEKNINIKTAGFNTDPINRGKLPPSIRQDEQLKIKYPRRKFATPSGIEPNFFPPSGRTFLETLIDILRQCCYGLMPKELKSYIDRLLCYDSSEKLQHKDGTAYTKREMHALVQYFKKKYNIRTVKPEKQGEVRNFYLGVNKELKKLSKQTYRDTTLADVQQTSANRINANIKETNLHYTVVNCNLTESSTGTKMTMEEKRTKLSLVTINFGQNGETFLIQCLVDTGCDSTILPRRILEDNGFKVQNHLYSMKTAEVEPNNTMLNGNSLCSLSFGLDSNVEFEHLVVCGGIDFGILGLDFIEKYAGVLKFGPEHTIGFTDENGNTVTAEMEKNKLGKDLVHCSINEVPVLLRANTTKTLRIICDPTLLPNLSNITIYEHIPLEVLSISDTYTTNLYLLTVKNTSEYPCAIPSRTSIGFIDQEYSELYNYHIKLKPWKLDVSDLKVYKETQVYSNLITQSLYEKVKLENGEELDVINDVAQVFDDDLDLPSKAEPYDLDEIFEKHKLESHAKKPLKPEEWAELKKMFLLFAPGGQYDQDNEEHTRVFMKDSHDLGFYRKELVRIDLIDEAKNSVIYEKTTPMTERMYEATKPTVDLWKQLKIFGPIHESGWNNKIQFVSKAKEGTAIATQVSKAKKKQNILNEPTTELSFRIVLNAKAINSIIKTSSILTADLDSNRAQKRDFSNKIFSALDLNSAFSSLVIHPEDRVKLSFSYHGEKLAYYRASQGIRGIPGIFSSIMSRILSPANYERMTKLFPNNLCIKTYSSFNEFLENYLDDVLLFTDRFTCKQKQLELHKDALFLVLFLLSENGFRIKPNRCVLYQDTLVFLGKVIDGLDNYTNIPLKKQTQILNLAKPSSKSEINSTICILNYFSQNLPFIRILALPLLRLLESSQPFSWGELENKAYENIMLIVALNIRCNYVDRELPLFVLSDISQLGGGGAVLQQRKDESFPRICSITNRLFAASERRKPPAWRECIWSTTHLKLNQHCVLHHPKPVLMMNDASGFAYLFKSKETDVSLNSAKSHLQGYTNLYAVHICSPLNILCDTLSRVYAYHIPHKNNLISPAAQDYIKRNFKEGDSMSPSEFQSLLTATPDPKFEIDITNYKEKTYKILPANLDNVLDSMKFRTPESALFLQILDSVDDKPSDESLQSFLMRMKLETERVVKDRLKSKEIVQDLTDMDSLDKIDAKITQLQNDSKIEINSMKVDDAGWNSLNEMQKIQIFSIKRRSRSNYTPEILPNVMDKPIEYKKSDLIIDPDTFDDDQPATPIEPEFEAWMNEKHLPATKTLRHIDNVVDLENKDFTNLSLSNKQFIEKAIKEQTAKELAEKVRWSDLSDQLQYSALESLKAILEFEYLPIEPQKFDQLYRKVTTYINKPTKDNYNSAITTLLGDHPNLNEKLKIHNSKFFWTREAMDEIPCYFKTYQPENCNRSFKNGNQYITVKSDSSITIKPGQLNQIILPVKLYMPRDLCAMIAAADGLTKRGVFVTNQIVAPDYSNQIILSLATTSTTEIELPAGMDLVDICLVKSKAILPRQLPDNLVVSGQDAGVSRLDELQTKVVENQLSQNITSYTEVRTHFMKANLDKNNTELNIHNQMSISKQELEKHNFTELYINYIKRENQTHIKTLEDLSDMTRKKLGIISQMLRFNGVISKELLISLQNSDAELKLVIEALNNKHHPKHEYYSSIFEIKTGVLFYKWFHKLAKSNTNIPPYALVLACPSVLAIEIVHNIHSKHLIHPDHNQTKLLVRRYIYHPDINSIVDRICDNCVQCMIGQKQRNISKMGLIEREHDDQPVQSYIYADHVVNLPMSNGYYHILVMMEAQSGFIQLYPCKSLGAEETIKHIKTFIKHYGPFQVFVTDQHKAFTALSTQLFLRQRGIEQKFSTAYTPQQNLAEGGVKICKQILSKLAAEPTQRNKWSDRLDEVVLTANSLTYPIETGSSQVDNLSNRWILFFGQINRHFPYNILQTFTEDEETLQKMNDELLEFKRNRTKKGRKGSKVHKNPYEILDIVIFIQRRKIMDGNSTSLQPQSKLLYLVTEATPNSVDLLNLVTGDKFNTNISNVRYPTIQELQMLTTANMKFIEKTIENFTADQLKQWRDLAPVTSIVDTLASQLDHTFDGLDLNSQQYLKTVTDDHLRQVRINQMAVNTVDTGSATRHHSERSIDLDLEPVNTILTSVYKTYVFDSVIQWKQKNPDSNEREVLLFGDCRSPETKSIETKLNSNLKDKCSRTFNKTKWIKKKKQRQKTGFSKDTLETFYDPSDNSTKFLGFRTKNTKICDRANNGVCNFKDCKTCQNNPKILFQQKSSKEILNFCINRTLKKSNFHFIKGCTDMLDISQQEYLL